MAKKKTTSPKKSAKTKAAPAKPAAAVPAPAAVESTPAAKTVEARAHEIWVAKGKPVPGTPLEDWLQAERELGARKA